MTTYKVQLVTADGNKYPVSVEKDQHILDAAMESDLNLPYTCYQPWSVTCNYTIDHGTGAELMETETKTPNTSRQNSQDLLEILLKEEKKKRLIRNLRLHKNVNAIN
jgi:ferredoxin